MSVTVVTQIQRVVVRGSGASYSDARVLAYLRSILTTNGDLLTVASNTLARIAVGAAPAGSVPVWNGSSWSVGTLTVAVAWDDVTGKPSTFPPSTHSHTPADVTGFNAAAVDAVEALGNGVLVTTGGTAAAVAGATANHALLWNGTTWVAGAVPYSALSGVPSTFAPSSHTHTASEITDFATAWTAQFTAFGSGASVDDVPKWNGSAWVVGAQSGGLTNPMTTAWDIIRGGASGTPTRLAVGRYWTALRVGADGTLAYRGPVAGFGRLPARYSLAIADGNGTPVMHGWTTAVTRQFSSSASGGRVAPRIMGCALNTMGTTAAAFEWAGWYMPASVSASFVPSSVSATGIFRRNPTTGNGYAGGLIVGGNGTANSNGPFGTQSPTANGAYFGIRCRWATQTTWHVVGYNGSAHFEVDTGVTVAANSNNTTSTNGATHGLVVASDANGVSWEVWNEITVPPTLLGSGRVATPVTAAAQSFACIGLGTISAAGDVGINALGLSGLTDGGWF